ncbi:MAG TPA: hypothetical protein VHH55_02945 [Gaiellaceae bacterium]|nr:hypothetical protein [Gaiellaceae bacterium]
MDALWALLFVIASVIVITYTRLPPEELYNVSERGVELGLGRALVFLNYPVSLVAIPTAWLAADRIDARWATWAALAATALCGVTALPGVVDQDDLDAKAVNLLPALGVAIALWLTVAARWERVGRLRLDPIRVTLGIAVWLVALIWLAAVSGLFFPGDFFLGEELRPGGDGLLAPAVHLGDHEGLDAALLATAALVLTRYRPRFAVAWLLGVALAYGLAVEWRDFWFEQVVKRGLTDWSPPQVLTPQPSAAWGGLIVLGLGVAFALRRFERPPRPG